MAVYPASSLEPGLTAWLHQLMVGSALHPAMRHALTQYVHALAHPAAHPHDAHALAATMGASADVFQNLLTDAHWSSLLLQHALLGRLQGIPALRWHDAGVLVIRAIGSRKHGRHLPYVGRQFLPDLGRRDLGRVTLLSFWTDGTVCYPLHVAHVTPPPAAEPGTRAVTGHAASAMALHLCTRATRLGISYRMVVGDLLVDGDGADLASVLDATATDYLLTTPLHRAAWPPHAQSAVQPHSPRAVARRLPASAWQPAAPLQPDAAPWFIAEVLPLPGPAGPRLLVLSSDRGTLPDATTWAVSTNLSPLVYDPPGIAQLAWMRQPADRWLDHARTTLGFDAYRGRSRRGLQRHQVLVCVAAAWPLVQPHLPPPPANPPAAAPAFKPAAPPTPVPSAGPSATTVLTPRRPRASRPTVQPPRPSSTPLAPLLRAEYGFPAALAAAYATRLAPHPTLRQIVLHWHHQHHLLEYRRDALSLYALLRTVPLLPLPAIRCLAAADPHHAGQTALEAVAPAEVQVRASGVRVYVDQTHVALADAPGTRSPTDTVDVNQDSDVFEVSGVNRSTLAVCMNWVRGTGSTPTIAWRRYPTYRSSVVRTAATRWTLLEWWPGDDGTGIWELVGEARPAGLTGPWEGAMPGTLIDRRWVVSPATLPLVADWILYGPGMRECWTVGLAGQY